MGAGGTEGPKSATQRPPRVSKAVLEMCWGAYKGPGYPLGGWASWWKQGEEALWMVPEVLGSNLKIRNLALPCSPQEGEAWKAEPRPSPLIMGLGSGSMSPCF